MPHFPDDDFPGCPACSKIFKTFQGLNAHLSSAKSCEWYRKGKIKAFGLDDVQPLPDPTPSPYNLDQPILQQQLAEEAASSFDWDSSDWPDLEEGNIDVLPSEDIDRDEFILLPNEPQAGPSQPNRSHPNMHRSLDDDEDTREEAPYPEATLMQDPLSEHHPFNSELDWRFAEWAVKDGPGHNAVNRLLAIPGKNLDYHTTMFAPYIRKLIQSLNAGDWQT
ncbi:hypothetical protein CPB84DRAFT_1843381 [Gymnopilus junonius]|uniref:C2H2-type domain-containing protein n=1 Tax=Gymnopilus junonius TaxID=109634 RepID=A0A9P5NZE9_GYMJU|nr:hypothetical protein CPB84DRAFT_1843381 [Gymnopilus junonius]